MLRIYLVPKIGDGVTPATAFRAKYMSRWDASEDVQLFPPGSKAIDFPQKGVMVVEADTTDKEHGDLLATRDVHYLDPDVKPTAEIGDFMESVGLDKTAVIASDKGSDAKGILEQMARESQETYGQRLITMAADAQVLFGKRKG